MVYRYEFSCDLLSKIPDDKLDNIMEYLKFAIEYKIDCRLYQLPDFMCSEADQDVGTSTFIDHTILR